MAPKNIALPEPIRYKPMKTIILLMSFFYLTNIAHAQSQLISYDDLHFMVENSLGKADTFLVSKGYTLASTDEKKKTQKFTTTYNAGTKAEINMRADGKRIYLEILTDEISQYNMIRNSILQFLIKDEENADIQTYEVKHLGTIYITIRDKLPYSPIRKDYDIHLVAQKNKVSYD